MYYPHHDKNGWVIPSYVKLLCTSQLGSSLYKTKITTLIVCIQGEGTSRLELDRKLIEEKVKTSEVVDESGKKKRNLTTEVEHNRLSITHFKTMEMTMVINMMTVVILMYYKEYIHTSVITSIIYTLNSSIVEYSFCNIRNSTLEPLKAKDCLNTRTGTGRISKVQALLC